MAMSINGPYTVSAVGGRIFVIDKNGISVQENSNGSVLPLPFDTHAEAQTIADGFSVDDTEYLTAIRYYEYNPYASQRIPFIVSTINGWTLGTADAASRDNLLRNLLANYE